MITEQQLNEQSLTITEQSKEIVVFSKEDNESANSLLRVVKEGQGMIRDYWKTPIDNANKVHKELTFKRGEMLKPLETAERMVKDKISDYLTEIEKKRREDQAKLQQQAHEEGLSITPVVEKEEKPQGQSSRTDWFVKSIDLKLLPDQYKIADEARISRIARAEKEKASIPGVVFGSKVVVISRR